MQTLTRQENLLSSEDLRHFMDFGYVVIHDCFSREVAKEWTGRAFEQIGYNPADPSSWVEERMGTKSTMEIDLKDFSPKAWQANCELLGGADRVKQPYIW